LDVPIEALTSIVLVNALRGDASLFPVLNRRGAVREV
jgi:hypothetical protein